MNALLLALVLAAGCQSTGQPKPNTKSDAWVVVPSANLDIIQSAIESVFREDMYQVARTDLTQIVLEKPGSRMDGLAYGSWLDTSVWVRIKVNIKPYLTDSFLIESDVYMVRHHGDTFFEEETKAHLFKKKPFRQLLEKVKKRVQAAPKPMMPPSAGLAPPPANSCSGLSYLARSF